MKIKMNESTIKENMGEVVYIGIDTRKVYDGEERKYTDEILSLRVNLGCEKMEDSFTVEVLSKEIPNVKKWGRVKFEGLEYDPYPGVNSYERDGATKSRGLINDRFRCERVLPATPADRKADEDGVVINNADQGSQPQPNAGQKPEKK